MPGILTAGGRLVHFGSATRTPGLLPGGDCATVGSMAALCAALQSHGFPVYVPSSSSDPNAHTVIINTLGFNVNAASLARYQTNVVGRPALLVGHSMGGGFSRIAISRYHARATGLFTIGTPHDGRKPFRQSRADRPDVHRASA